MTTSERVNARCFDVDAQHQKEPSGCTAVLTLVTEDNTIYCANSGDSRAVLSDGGLAVPLSTDHKPVNPGKLSILL